jgi:hypothetical protein
MRPLAKWIRTRWAQPTYISARYESIQRHARKGMSIFRSRPTSAGECLLHFRLSSRALFSRAMDLALSNSTLPHSPAPVPLSSRALLPSAKDLALSDTTMPASTHPISTCHPERLGPGAKDPAPSDSTLPASAYSFCDCHPERLLSGAKLRRIAGVSIAGACSRNPERARELASPSFA